MADQIVAQHTTRSGKRVAGKMFPKYAMGLRGVVGVVDVPGAIRSGDSLIVKLCAPTN
jgi:hypothetical protein